VIRNLKLTVTLCLLACLRLGAADTAADANYTDIIDPVKLSAMSEAVMAHATFDGDTVPAGAVLADGLAGKGLDLAATKTAVVFDCPKVLNPSAGAVSLWIRFRSEVTVAGVGLISIDGGGPMYITYNGRRSSDPRHRHRTGFCWLAPNPGDLNYPYPICPLDLTKVPNGTFWDPPSGASPEPRWVNLVWTWEGNHTYVYVDGILAGQQTFKGNLPDAVKGWKRLTLGAPGQDAILDEVRFYNRVLTQADVRGYVSAARSGALRETALRLPAALAGKIAGSLHVVYRVSDHALVLYAGLGDLMATEGDARIRVVAVKGAEVLQQAVHVLNPGKAFRAVLPLPANLPDGEYSVTLQVDAQDKPLEARFSRKRYPWEGNRLGLGEGVPKPWTPVQVAAVKPQESGVSALAKDTLTVKVWGREYRFAGMGLPVSALTRQPEPLRGRETADILAGPVRVEAVGKHGTLPWTDASCKIASRSERQVAIAGSARSSALNLALSGTLEFDGFYKATVRLTPTKPNVELDQLRIEIPVPDGQALLFNAASDQMRSQKAFLNIEGQPDGELWNSIKAITGGREQVLAAPEKPRDIPVWPHAWLGNDDRGIALMVENTRTWKIDRKQPVMDLVRKGGVTTLRLLPLNVPATISEPIEITFSLQATPVRPRPAGGSWKALNWYGWGYFDGPVIAADLEPGAITREGVGPYFPTPEAKKENRWWKYGCLQSFRVSPNDPVYGDMVKATDDEWGAGLYTPSHIDFLLWVYEKWHEKESLDGMYYDNTYPQRAGDFGSGIAYLDADGGLQPSYNVFGQRDFLKRLQNYFQSVGPLPVLKAHVTDCPAVGYLGFADFWLDGECGGYPDSAMKAPDFVDRWYNPTGLTNLRITLGRQWGTMPMYLYGFGMDATHAVLGMFDLANGCVMGTVSADASYNTTSGLKYDFGLHQEDCRYRPYWHVSLPVRVRRGNGLGTAATRTGSRQQPEQRAANGRAGG